MGLFLSAGRPDREHGKEMKNKELVKPFLLIIVLVGVLWVLDSWQQDEKYCKQDSDCGWVSCCHYDYKCMKKDALFCPEHIICLAYIEPIPSEPCICINNKCTEKQPEKQVTINTDKTEYEQGEIVKTTTFNGLEFFIYADSWKGGWRVLQYKNEQWDEIFNGRQRTLPICLCEEYPDGNCPLWEAPQEKFDEFKPSETVIWSWDQKILQETDKGCYKQIDASPGTYKVEFRHFYTLDPNKREWKKVYSNEFTIKEKDIL